MANIKYRRLAESAVMIALGTILSFIQINGPWINGGSVTAASMVPCMIIAYRYGVKWGIFTGGVYGILQLLFGLGSLKTISNSFLLVVGAVVLDYLVAFGAMGLAGLFRKSKNVTVSFTCGVVVACVVRFLCHFISGFLIWRDIMQDGFAGIAYSFGYNISYMGPEFVINIVVSIILGAGLHILGKKVNVKC